MQQACVCRRRLSSVCTECIVAIRVYWHYWLNAQTARPRAKVTIYSLCEVVHEKSNGTKPK